MSKIGKLPIKVPEGVSLEVNDKIVKVKGPKGELSRTLPTDIGLEVKDNIVTLTAKGGPEGGSVYGTTRALVANMINGVSKGWVRELELVGTGYRAEVSGKDLILTVGYSHPVTIPAPEGITFKVEKTIITVAGIDKELVGQMAANIRGVREPEPYKGKGIKYKDEIIRRKAGKVAKAAGAVGGA